MQTGCDGCAKEDIDSNNYAEQSQSQTEYFKRFLAQQEGKIILTIIAMSLGD